MPLVDQFIPVPSQHNRPSLKSSPRLAAVPPQPRPAALPVAKPFRAPHAPPRAARRRVWLRRLGGFVLLVLAFAAINYGAEFLFTSELAIGVYGVAVVVKRLPSRLSFALALLALLSVMLQLAVLPDGGILAQNTTVMAFLLLVVATVSLVIETQKQRIRPFKRRRS